VTSSPPAFAPFCAVATLLAACACALASAGCPTPGRDVVPETRDVRGAVADAGAPPPNGDYVYVVRRPHGDVGLVGAHFMSDADAKRIVDRVADDLEACATRVEQRGDLATGAIQLVAVTGSRGTAEVSDMKLAPGGPVAANALECIVAPLRASAFPAATNAGVPALAIEATWGAARREAEDSRGDGGRPLR
jgi:hypothetical protein